MFRMELEETFEVGQVSLVHHTGEWENLSTLVENSIQTFFFFTLRSKDLTQNTQICYLLFPDFAENQHYLHLRELHHY